MPSGGQGLTSRDISYTWTNSSRTEFVLHFEGTGIVRGFVGPGRKSFSLRIEGQNITTFRRMVDAKMEAAELWSKGHRVAFAGGKSVVASLPTLWEGDQDRLQKSFSGKGSSVQHSTFEASAFPYLHKYGEYAKLLNRKIDLVSLINKVKRDELRDEYLRLIECAPRRADRGKRYFVDGHSGIPSGGSGSNRYEEHLAMALWNLKKPWPRQDGSQFCMLDYQVPLRARQSDRGIGEVDLMGLTTEKQLMVIELKVKPESTSQHGDTPAAALLQGLRYAAIVQANRNVIAKELENLLRISVAEQPPVVMLLAPQDWWQGWMKLPDSTRNAVGNWELAFTKLAREIEEEIGVTIECATLSVERVQLTFGGNRLPPQLDRMPKISYLRPGIR